jgi:hypothetical protein
MVTPEAAGFMFLLEVGRWAKDELSQRWLYRRQVQAETKVEDITELDAESPVLQETWNEMTKTWSEAEVKRVLHLIKTQGELILGYEQSQSNARKQALVDGNEMLLRNRLQHYDEEIELARQGMQQQAKKLGIEITEYIIVSDKQMQIAELERQRNEFEQQKIDANRQYQIDAQLVPRDARIRHLDTEIKAIDAKITRLKEEKSHPDTTELNDNKSRKLLMYISIIVIIVVFLLGLVGAFLNSCEWFNICRLKPFPDEAFVVAVAGFGFDTGESIERNDDSVQMTNTIFSSLEGITEPEYLIGPNQIGYILQPTGNERREKAFQLVRDYNIDILVYGVVDTDDTYLTFHPQFAYNTTWASQEPELFLVNEPIELLRYTSNETPTQINERISVINIFLSGLANYIKGNYEQSYELFIDATEINVERVQTSGYIYVFAANAASRAGNNSLALDALDVVLTTDPTNSRALYARGNALLNMAAHEIDYYDPLLDFDGRCLSQPPDPLDRRRMTLIAIRCFEEARDSTSANAQIAQIPLRANVSIGQAQMFIASLPGGEFERIETAQQIFSDAIIEFTNLGSPSELNYFGGLAYLGRGDAQRTIICTDDGTISESEYQRIVNDYEIALDLISTSVGHASDYIKDTILYPLENRIATPVSRGCETSYMWE